MFPAAASTRKVASTLKAWADVATNGQLGAVDFLTNHYSALLVADRGAGKTAIALEAFCRLKKHGKAHKMLVIAPLRVCQLVWRQEAEEWEEFKHLRFSLLHGPKKKERLRDNADVWLINPEGCQWLADQYWGRALPWDVVTIDQTIRFKAHGGKRAKKIRARLGHVRHRWGLEGALIPNGYLDLFGQMLMLDDGAALGKYITHYRDAYFTKDGFSYDLMPGAAHKIEKRIQPYVFRLPYNEKPPLKDDIIRVELSPEERKTYNRMKKTMLTEVAGTKVTAANSAAVYGKLKQLANGAVYTGNGKEWLHVHDTKLDALEELIDELGGNPLLIGYEFRHDLERILKRFPNMRTFDGINEREAIALQDDWNAGKIPYLAAHPAQIGHGLNLQKGAACHVCWFSATIDLNLYEEFIGRLLRRGNKASHVNNHIIVANDTIDDVLTLPALKDKALTQDTLHKRLEMALTDIRRDAENPNRGVNGGKETDTMVGKLSRQNGADTTAPAVVVASVRPAAWAGRGGNGAAPALVDHQGEEPKANPFARRGSAPEPTQQREEIRQRISQPAQDVQQEEAPANIRARGSFSTAVQRQLDAPKGEADAMAQQVDRLADVAHAKEHAEQSGISDAVRGTRTRRKSVEDAPNTSHLRSVALELAVRYKASVVGSEDPDDVTQVANVFLGYLETGKWS